MALETYRSCSFAEKRRVLRAFWTRRGDPSDRVLRAAREYGPYALVMVGIISLELGVITVALAAAASPWAWVGAVATLADLAAVLWARACRRAIAPTARD